MSTRMLPRRVLLLVALSAVLALTPAGAASAGGWAVTTLDAVPSVQPGKAVAVGFTIRQHGVTPVWVEGEVAIVATSAAGTTHVFAGVPEGPEGHYVATVTLADPGTYRWQVRQGWFAPQELGELVVGASSTAGPAAAPTDVHRDTGPRAPLGLRVLLPIAAAALLGALVVDVRRRRALSATAV